MAVEPGAAISELARTITGWPIAPDPGVLALAQIRVAPGQQRPAESDRDPARRHPPADAVWHTLLAPLHGPASSG